MMFSAFVLPMCHRSFSSTRCFIATWADGSRCCIEQPPQCQKCGHFGSTRMLDAFCSVTMRPDSQFFFLRRVSKLTRSPGSAPSTKITLPGVPSSFSRWPTPRASVSRDLMLMKVSCMV